MCELENDSGILQQFLNTPVTQIPNREQEMIGMLNELSYSQEARYRVEAGLRLAFVARMSMATAREMCDRLSGDSQPSVRYAAVLGRAGIERRDF